MGFDFKLPDVGEGLHEGTLVEWLVNIGDPVRLDQPFARVETDKAVVELPAPKPGVVQALHFGPGDVIEVGQVMITFDDASGGARSIGTAGRSSRGKPANSGAARTPTPTSSPQPHPARSPRRPLATPHTRALARRLGVDITTVVATGKGGKTTDADVHRAAVATGASPSGAPDAREQRRNPTEQLDPVQLAARPPKTVVLPAVSHAHTSIQNEPQGEVERRPVTHLRRVIAEAMATSKRTAAHCTHVDEADVTDLLACYRRAKARLAREESAPKFSILPYFLKAVVNSLKRHPELNASYDEQRNEILVKRYYHLGVAVDTDQGLVVPVLRHADRKDLVTIAGELQDLAARARTRRLSVEELRGGTFTVSSLGPLGGAFATPIIHQPELAIIGLHAIKRRPGVVGDQVVPRDLMYVSLSYDHRFIDGAVAARFIVDVIGQVENPDLMMLRM